MAPSSDAKPLSMSVDSVPTQKDFLSNPTTNPELKSPKSLLPPVLEYDAATCTSNDLVKTLKLSGGVIVRRILEPEDVQQIEADVRPWLDNDKPWNGDFFPPETRRAVGLLGKSKTFALRLVGNEMWLEVVDALLTSEFHKNWVSAGIVAVSA